MNTLMAQGRYIVLLMVMAVIATAIAGFSIFELQSSNELLKKIALVQPGVNLNTVKERLGEQMYCFSDVDQMRARGSIKDPSFYEGKKLYWFVGSKYPWRALEVYTDKNDIVVYVTWQGL